MLPGKNARRLAAALLFGLLGGCAHTPARRPTSPPAVRPPTVSAPAVPVHPAPVQLASAQGPQLPPLAPTPPPGPASPPAGAESPLRRLHALAARDFATVDSYTCRLTRREQVNGKMNPIEVIRFQFRKEPWSVRFAWLDGEAKGREVIHVKGQHDNKLHTLLASGDVPLMPAGRRMALPPDSLLVRSASRHTVTEAGVGNAVERFGSLVEANEKGDHRRGVLTYVGPQKRPDVEGPTEGVEQTIPPGVDKDLPRGGRRWWFFDPATRNLPVLIVTHDDRGQEVEYYRHDLFFFHRLGDDDFNPDRLWGKR